MRSERRQSIAYSISVVLLLCLGSYLLISIYDHANAASERDAVFVPASETKSPKPLNVPPGLGIAGAIPLLVPSASTSPEPVAEHVPPVAPDVATPATDAVTKQETYEEPPKTHTYETTAYYLNVRESANASSRILDVLERGTVIEVTKTTDNGWLRLKAGGYVHGSYTKQLEGIVRIASYEANAISTERAATVDASAGDTENAKPITDPSKPSSIVKSDSGLTEEDIALILDGTELAGEGLEKVILEVEEEHGINAYFTIAVMKLESGNGESRLAKKKNNLFGLNAIAGDAFNKAHSFKTKADCVRKFGQLIADNYVDQGYTTVEKVAKKYCPANSKWPSHVKMIMKRDYERI